MEPALALELGIGLGWSTLLACLGWTAAGWFQPRLQADLRAAVAFPLGAGATTYALFLLSWAGLPLNPASVLAAAVLLLLLVLALRQRRREMQADRREPDLGRPTAGPDLARWLSYAAIIVLTLAAVVISLVTSYSVWDGAAIWSAKGYGIALEGTIFAGAEWGAHGLSYPLNVPLQISALWLLSGDQLPISKLAFPLYYGSSLLAVLALLRRGRLTSWLTPAAVLVLGMTPVVFEHAWIGYANLPLACYVLLGSIVSADVVRDSEGESVLLAAVLLAAAAWTRVEGLLYLTAVVASVALASLLLDNLDRAKIIRLGAFSLAFASPWLLFYVLYGAGSSQAARAWSEVVAAWSSGRGDLYPLRLIFGYFRRAAFERHTWGLFFVVTPGLALLGWRSYVRERDGLVVVLGLSGVGAALVSVLLYYGVYFISPDFLAWLARDFPRAFLPAALLLFASAATAGVASFQAKAGATGTAR